MESDEIGDSLLGDHSPIDADAFAEIDKMRRSEEADLIAGAMEDGCEEVGDRAFAIGTGHMDAAERAMRLAEMLHELDGIEEVGLIGLLAYEVIHRQRGEHIVESVLICHRGKERRVC